MEHLLKRKGTKEDEENGFCFSRIPPAPERLWPDRSAGRDGAGTQTGAGHAARASGESDKGVNVMEQGQLLFYGGLWLMAGAVLLGLAALVWFRLCGKRLRARLNELYGEEDRRSSRR